MEKVTEGVYRLGSRWVNFYLIVERGAATLVDTGLSGYRGQVHAALEDLGLKPSDVKAIVLTHTHVDHIGAAPELIGETGAPVFVHQGEAAIARGEQKPGQPKGLLSSLWRPHIWRFLGHAVANKAKTRVTIPEVMEFAGDAVLDVPGRLRAVSTPGHSRSHSALLAEDRRILFCGDAMATFAVDTGRTGPMLHPFNEDPDEAIGSLDVLEKVEAGVLLPGHGDPYRGRVADAVAAARRGL